MFYANAEERQNSDVLIEKYNKLSNLNLCNQSTSEDSISISEDLSIIESSIKDLLDSSFNKEKSKEKKPHKKIQEHEVTKIENEKSKNSDEISVKKDKDKASGKDNIALECKQASVNSISSKQTKSRSPDPKEGSKEIEKDSNSTSLNCTSANVNSKETKDRADSSDKIKYDSLE